MGVSPSSACRSASGGVAALVAGLIIALNAFLLYQTFFG